MKNGNIEFKDLGSNNRVEIKGTYSGKDKTEYKVYFKGSASKVWSNYFSISFTNWRITSDLTAKTSFFIASAPIIIPQTF